MIENFLNKKYDFYFNEVRNRVYFKNKENDSYELLGDFELNSIKRELSSDRITSTKSNLIELLHSNFVVKKNPFLDYMNSLPP